MQRIGRTGRKRTGYIHILTAQGREERNMQKSKGKYKEVQQSIMSGKLLELYGDVERLIPDHICPIPLFKLMEIEAQVTETDIKKTTKIPGRKRKRNDDE